MAFASGAQLMPLNLGGAVYLPRQTNNFYTFSIVSQAVRAIEARRVPNKLFNQAAKAAAAQVSTCQLEQDMSFPLRKGVQKFEVQTAITLMKASFEFGSERVEKPKDISAMIQALQYKQGYA